MSIYLYTNTDTYIYNTPTPRRCAAASAISSRARDLRARQCVHGARARGAPRGLGGRGAQQAGAQRAERGRLPARAGRGAPLAVLPDLPAGGPADRQLPAPRRRAAYT